VRPEKADVFSGSQPRRGKSQSPVTWVAGWRETKTLKPTDEASRGWCVTPRAITEVNAQVGGVHWDLTAPRSMPARLGVATGVRRPSRSAVFWSDDQVKGPDRVSTRYRS
jgi:hypothetical protein